MYIDHVDVGTGKQQSPGRGPFPSFFLLCLFCCTAFQSLAHGSDGCEASASEHLCKLFGWECGGSSRRLKLILLRTQLLFHNLVSHFTKHHLAALTRCKMFPPSGRLSPCGVVLKPRILQHFRTWPSEPWYLQYGLALYRLAHFGTWPSTTVECAFFRHCGIVKLHL